MRCLRLTALLLAVVPLTPPRAQPPVPHAAPGQPPVARLFVHAETGAEVEVAVGVVGGELRALAPDTARGARLVRRTPLVLETHGDVRTLEVRSRPEHPLRVHIALPGVRGEPAVHRGWTLRFRRDGDRFVPVAQALPVPPR